MSKSVVQEIPYYALIRYKRIWAGSERHGRILIHRHSKILVILGVLFVVSIKYTASLHYYINYSIIHTFTAR